MARLLSPFRSIPAAAPPTAEEPPTDRVLLDRFREQRDQASFEELVRRHRGLVMGTCRRVLRNAADAEDAFQATFLVLAKKASDLRWQSSLAGWLHETARRTALKSAESLARARRREKIAGEQRASQEAAPPSIEDLAVIVDEELARLPDKFREPLTLHLFEELTRDETASRLHLTPAAVKDRLERGRELLRSRLLARGVTYSAAALTTWLSVGSASAAAPASLAATITPAAIAFASGNVVAGLVSAPVLTLAQGVLQMYAFAKLKTSLLACASVALVAGLAFGMLVETPGRFEKGLLGKIEAIDRTANPPRILIDLDELNTRLSLDADPKAKVFLAYEQGGLDLLNVGQYVSLRLGEDHRTVKEIHARGKTHHIKIVFVLSDKIVGEIDDDDDDDENNAAPKKVEFALAKDPILAVGNLPARVDQLNAGLKVRIEIGKDGRTVHAITGDIGEDRRMEGRIVEIDLAGKGLKVSLEKDDVEVEMWVKMIASPIVRIDGKTAAAADLRPNSHYRARLTADGVAIESLSVENRKDDNDE